MDLAHQKSADEPVPQSVSGFTAPFGLVNQLHRPKLKLDFVPVLDLIVIGLLMILLFCIYRACEALKWLYENILRLKKRD